MLLPTILLGALAELASPAFAESTAAPEGAAEYIVSPTDGGSVSRPAKVVFGLRGMGITSAGVEAENTGHHDLLINVELAELDMENLLPATDNVVHFGGGQTEVVIELPAGEH